MRNIFLIVVCIILFSSHPAQAHLGGHGGNEEVIIREADVIPTASAHVAELIKQRIELKDVGRLDKSWSSVPPSGKKIIRKGEGFYIVGFEHPTEKKTLFLLLSSMGDLYSVNFSGEFEGVEEEIGN